MRKLKNWLNSYIEYSKYSEAPESFHYWSGVSAMAGALKRRVWIDMGFFEWTPNFYIIFVAPPGIVSKSTTINISMNLLRQVPGVTFGPDAATWQVLTQSLANSLEEVPMGEEFIKMSCMTIASSEFGTFMDPNDREMVDVMVSLWDGQKVVWEKATKTQGSDVIENPWINLIACTTPSWIAGNFPEYMIGGGFTSRCVFVFASKKRHLVAYPATTFPTTHVKLRDDLIHDLEEISLMIGEMKLDKSAYAWGEEWYKDHYAEIERTHSHSSIFGGYQARKQTHIHKLAIVVAAAESSGLTITSNHLREAERRVTQLETDMPEVFSLIGKSLSSRVTDQVRELISSSGVIRRADLVATLSATLGIDEIENGLRTVVEAQECEVRTLPGGDTMIIDTKRALHSEFKLPGVAANPQIP